MSPTKRNLIWNFKLNTMDITIAVIVGVITAVYTTYIPLYLLETFFLSLGVYGWMAFYLYEGIYFVLFTTAGWLRKKAGVIMLAGVVTGFIDYLLGIPEGPLLMVMLFAGGLVTGLFLHYVNWRRNFLTAWVAGGLFFLAEETLFFFGTGFWPETAIEVIGVYIIGFITNGIITGYISRLIADALTRAGIAEVELE